MYSYSYGARGEVVSAVPGANASWLKHWPNVISLVGAGGDAISKTSFERPFHLYDVR
jgi:hypothetical protein